ncbi:MAG: efflux RND transporter periplasmic adaptor subunit [Lewinellaceae bacterium]|nr:efflux RND transporter periplasmic adaptor subunit [Lewinellaceae bacterium]
MNRLSIFPIRLLSLITLFGITLLVQACKGSAAEEAPAAIPADRAIPVAVSPVELASLVVPIQVAGIVSSSNEARPAFKTGGVIARVLVGEGDFVREGQLLATLNPTEIKAQVQQASEAVDKAQRDLQRAQNLYADSVATLEQVQNAKTGLTVAQQGLQIARFNQSYSEIRSPISGKVVKQLMNEGEVVGPGTPVFYILSNARQDWVVKTGLADRDWARLNPGDAAVVTLDAYPGQSFPAKVSRLAIVGNPQNGTFDAEFSLVGNPPRLAAGLVANVVITPPASSPQLTIPIDALVEAKGNKAYVFVVDGEYARRTVVTIASLYEGKAAIASGLSAEQQVVTLGAPYLEDGNRITINQ